MHHTNQITLTMISTQTPIKEMLSAAGIKAAKAVHYQLTPAELIEETILRNQGKLADTGALCINTGKFTGRSPKDRFIVKDELTAESVDWNEINVPFEDDAFVRLQDKLTAYFEDKEIFVRDAICGADKDYAINVRVFTEYPWSNLFVYNMFIRPTGHQLANFTPDWTVLNAPGFLADPDTDGTRSKNFAIVNFKRKTIIIGGTGYTGEIKKGIFSVMNFLLPTVHNVLPMHCSANVGKMGDTAVFFGLSGTGKTTLSADPNRRLIGDDEHGWCNAGVFNFEGGCYAKTINLSPKYEPEIYGAIKHGAILENIGFHPNSRTVNFEDTTITQNTRVSYPIYHIPNIMVPSEGGQPRNIFFLTCDAFGVLPPISQLTPGQAMYHFISGYTAKVAGTEVGVTDPEATFSACFGAPFMPLHPTAYAEMLGKRQKEENVKIWLVNTGWSGGNFGVGSRIKLKYTRAMISAALEGALDHVRYREHEIFGLFFPSNCPNVPNELLNPSQTWADKDAYNEKAQLLARKFQANFAQFADMANEEILSAAPKVS